MTDIVNVHEAKTHLSKLLARVEAGEEIILARGGAPIAKIVPIPAQREWAGPGAWKGKYDIPDDAFEWSEEELREMFGSSIFPDEPADDAGEGL
ncbi:MAG: type II toxin-antitoxin system Phd/YefM family antitoxin [Gaiellales bacterium]|nr:type II toxin-antitoxin system Phd/YefM family antitoxin [Gaiellales bacterium]